MQAARSSIRSLVGLMLLIVVIGILIARSYYGNMNRSVDPRVLKARELYGNYNDFAREGNYYALFSLLDSIEQVYRGVKHYRKSFEIGVLENNRAAAMLTLAIYGDSIPQAANPFPELHPDSLITLAKAHVERAIAYYEQWNTNYQKKSSAQIEQLIRDDFLEGLTAEDPQHAQKYLDTRVAEIEDALVENERRLSVCYTNLGLVYRYRRAYEEAVRCYEIAIDLWDRNLDAENNLNKLLNRPLKKRNIIQRLFPPPKE